MYNKTEDEELNSVYIKDYLKAYFEDSSEENAFIDYFARGAPVIRG